MAARSSSRATAAKTTPSPVPASSGHPPPRPADPNPTGSVNVTRVVTPPTPEPVPQELRRQMILQAAYLRAEQRGFTPGFELDDWLAAENEVDSLLRERYR